MGEVVAKYNCKQIELYAVAGLAILSFRDHQAALETFKPKYKPGYELVLRTLWENASTLKGFQARDERSETALVHVREKAELSRDKWQRLKRYIVGVQDWQNVQKSKVEAAGQLSYEKAGADNWEYVTELMQMGSKFLEENEAELMEDENMPNTFRAEFDLVKDEFAIQYGELMDAVMDDPEQTEAKVTANNLLHDELSMFLGDAQVHFAKNKAVAKRFTFSQLLNIVRRPGTRAQVPVTPQPGLGTGSVAGKVTRTDTNVGLSDVEIEVVGTEIRFGTDANGNYVSPNLAVGSHVLKFWHEEMESREMPVAIANNVVLAFDIGLSPLG